MLDKYGYAFYDIGQLLEGISTLLEKYDEETLDKTVGESTRAVASKRVKEVEAWCEAVGLDFALMSVRRFLSLLEKEHTYRQQKEILKDIQRRIVDQLDSALFLYVPKEKVEKFTSPQPFGEAVNNNFSSASFDIEEAGKCFATERHTACVMHLMRSLEVALDAVGLGVGVPNATIEAHSSWERLLEKIRKQIEANDKAADPAWTPKRQFFVDSAAHLFAVKNAWRNPSMHLEKKYDEREAERIYRAVQDFMEHLATHLDESGQFAP